MPIYEYQCRGCGHHFEQLIIHSTTPECPTCQGHDLERLISMFAVDSETTRGSALKAGRQKNAQLTREKNQAEIEYHKKHDHH
jgi:putative FmdB family regulatory protein